MSGEENLNTLLNKDLKLSGISSDEDFIPIVIPKNQKSQLLNNDKQTSAIKLKRDLNKSLKCSKDDINKG